jgi:hypothetical protein
MLRQFNAEEKKWRVNSLSDVVERTYLNQLALEAALME